MRARLFVPVLFAVSSVGGLAFAERTGGGASSHAVHEHAVHEHAVHVQIDRTERLRAHGDMHEKTGSSGSSHAGRAPSGWAGRGGRSDTSCRPGSSGCGQENRPTVTRESHFTKTSAPTAADKQQAARLSQMLQAKLCAKAHCGEQ